MRRVNGLIVTEGSQTETNLYGDEHYPDLQEELLDLPDKYECDKYRIEQDWEWEVYLRRVETYCGGVKYDKRKKNR